MRPGAGPDFGNACLAIVALLTFAAPANAGSDDIRTFRDWIAGCDNTGACTALSLPQAPDDDLAYLRLERPAGPDGAPVLALKLRGDRLEPTFDVEMLLDGAPFPAKARRWPATSADRETAAITLAPADAEALIAAARKVTALTVKADGRTFKLSLAGSVAAMLWVDERQGRLDTASALIRRGAGKTVPPARPLPLLSVRPAARTLDAKAGKRLATALRRHLKTLDPESCTDPPTEILLENDEAWALDEQLNLVALGCGNGPYNSWSGFWTVRGEEVATAKPVRLADSDSRDGNILVNAAFDPAKATLDYFSKGRGIADCGSVGSYAWTGTAFISTSLVRMPECRGIGWDDWITLYRSDVRTAK